LFAKVLSTLGEFSGGWVDFDHRWLVLVRSVASADFQTHREHLHCQGLAAKGSPIGTCAMESTCGQLQTRVKRTGQF